MYSLDFRAICQLSSMIKMTPPEIYSEILKIWTLSLNTPEQTSLASYLISKFRLVSNYVPYSLSLIKHTECMSCQASLPPLCCKRIGKRGKITSPPPSLSLWSAAAPLNNERRGFFCLSPWRVSFPFAAANTYSLGTFIFVSEANWAARRGFAIDIICQLGYRSPTTPWTLRRRASINFFQISDSHRIANVFVGLACIDLLLSDNAWWFIMITSSPYP